MTILTYSYDSELMFPGFGWAFRVYEQKEVKKVTLSIAREEIET